MPFSTAIQDRERDKFVEKPVGETSVRVFVSNETGDAIPVTGSFSATSSYAAPTGPFLVSVATITDVSSNPIPVPLTDRVSLSIRNLSTTDTVYIGPSIGVTADNTATGGWDIGPGEDLHLDLNDANLFHAITPTGTSAQIKIMEISSNGAGGGGSSLTAVKEIPSGAVDGSNTTFTISQIPASESRFLLFQNGLLLTVTTDYTRVGATITMTTAPAIGQELLCWYEY